MVALKGAQIDAFVARPDPQRSVVLVFGPDAGLVRERVEALIRASVDDPRDPFALARIEGDELASEPTRLVEEANTVPLFGGRRAVWVKAGSRNFAAAVEALLKAAVAGLPRGDRGRRPQAQCAVARGDRARRQCGGAAVLCRCGARGCAPDRRRDARRRPLDRSRRPRGAAAAARRRPPGLTQRGAQARAVRTRPRARRSSTT